MRSVVVAFRLILIVELGILPHAARKGLFLACLTSLSIKLLGVRRGPCFPAGTLKPSKALLTSKVSSVHPVALGIIKGWVVIMRLVDHLSSSCSAMFARLVLLERASRTKGLAAIQAEMRAMLGEMVLTKCSIRKAGLAARRTSAHPGVHSAYCGSFSFGNFTSSSH
jgi:hypothetical protein